MQIMTTTNNLALATTTAYRTNESQNGAIAAFVKDIDADDPTPPAEAGDSQHTPTKPDRQEAALTVIAKQTATQKTSAEPEQDLAKPNQTVMPFIQPWTYRMIRLENPLKTPQKTVSEAVKKSDVMITGMPSARAVGKGLIAFSIGLYAATHFIPGVNLASLAIDIVAAAVFCLGLICYRHAFSKKSVDSHSTDPKSACATQPIRAVLGNQHAAAYDHGLVFAART
jgi:hypothetical protein